MRLSAVAATLVLAVASAQPQDNYGAADTSSFTTWTMTRTVNRVVQTVTATRDNSSHPTTTVSPPLHTASLGVTPYGNGTEPTVVGTGAGPSGSGATQAPTDFPVSGAERVGLEGLGLMAIVGLVGFVGL
ncbi:hypothetical protein Q7P37_000740 [Cladosporium fusiforme]|jgi:hypothetical protein